MKLKAPTKPHKSRSKDDEQAGDDPSQDEAAIAPRVAPRRAARAPVKTYIEIGSDDDAGDQDESFVFE